jgi:hypothetical protein
LYARLFLLAKDLRQVNHHGNRDRLVVFCPDGKVWLAVKMIDGV